MLLAVAATGLVFTGCCKHKCCLNDPGRTPNPYRPPAPSTPFLLPPTNVPTAPAPGAMGPDPLVPGVSPAPSNFPPPSLDLPPSNPSPRPAPEVLPPDPLPGSGSSRGSAPAASPFAG